MSVNKVYLIRHGETDFNREGRLQGSLPIPLNDKGRLEAKALGTYLKQHSISALFSSPLKRSHQTADILGQILDLDVQVDPRLREMSFGSKFEGLVSNEIETKYPDEYRMWRSGDMSYVVPSGESRRAVQHRMSEAWNDLTSITEYETIALISHGVALKVLLQISVLLSTG